jgi:hypothetical protein
MIKVVLKNPSNEPVVLLGITRDNVTQLELGRPIAFELADLGLPAGKGVIFFAETHQDLVTELRAHGVPLGNLPDPEPGETLRYPDTHG